MKRSACSKSKSRRLFDANVESWVIAASLERRVARAHGNWRQNASAPSPQPRSTADRHPNRSSFNRCLDRRMGATGGSELCVLLIDLDDFKTSMTPWDITLGRDALSEVPASAWRLPLRPSDLTARGGGKVTVIMSGVCRPA